MSRYVVTRYRPIESTNYTYRPKGNTDTSKILNIYKEALFLGLDLNLLVSIWDNKTNKTYYYNKQFEEINYEEFLQLMNQIKLKHYMGV